MKLPRRNFLHLAAGAAALPAVSPIAWAQTYPSRPVRIIVGFPAGLTPDIIARLVGQRLSEHLGQQVVVENRPGAGSNIGTEFVVRASPDGYTLLLATGSNAVSATLYEKLNFNFTRDIAPVASIGRGPFILVINPSFPAKTVPEFIAYAKANPGKINVASAGSGTTPHLAGELFKIRTRVDWAWVQSDTRSNRGARPGLIYSNSHIAGVHQNWQAARRRRSYRRILVTEGIRRQRFELAI